MKLSKLLASRHSIVRQAHLAALAHAYVTVQRLAARVAAARLRGRVRLQAANPLEERYWASLTALEGNQSLIEEHFADEELMHLADAAELATEATYTELEFPLEELAERFAQPIRAALQQAGVVLDHDDAPNPAADTRGERK